MRKIALVNQKGGVGKTTTAVNLSAGLARLGSRVLLIDFDPQGNASVAFGINTKEDRKSVYHVLRGDAPAREAILPVSKNLDLLPASIDLAGAEVELISEIGREFALRDALATVTDYDFILLDCPPSLGLININALAYVEEVIIPVECEFFALHGISQLLDTIRMVQKRIQPRLRVSGVVACKFDARTGLSKEVVSNIRGHFAERVFKTMIRNNVRLAEAPGHAQSIFDYAPTSPGAEDYAGLAREVAAMQAPEPNPGRTSAGSAPSPTVVAPPETAAASAGAPAGVETASSTEEAPRVAE